MSATVPPRIVDVVPPHTIGAASLGALDGLGAAPASMTAAYPSDSTPAADARTSTAGSPTPPTSPTLARRASRIPSLMIGALLIGTVLLLAASADWLFPGDPMDMNLPPFLRPGAQEGAPLGSDMMGRDIAAGIFHGARISLLIGAVATAISLALGVAGGALGGYYGGWVDAVVMRVTEFFQAIPPFLFALTIVVILPPTIGTISFAIGITAWPSLVRLVRAEILRWRHSELVHASIAMGASDARIIVLHLLPNALVPILVSTSLMVANAILTESGLAFLGLGDPNVISWGSMIGAGRTVLRTDWYITAIPGLAIMLAVLGLNLLGDGLGALLDPKGRRR